MPRVGKNLYSLVIMAGNAQSGFVRRLVAGLAQKVGIRVAPATHVRPVEAIINSEHALDADAYGVPPGAKRVVRVLSDGKWIKKI